MKWTKAYRRAHGKEMMMDSSFNFEKKRMAPVKYNRNLMVKTIQAMQTVERIKQVRKERFQKQRLATQLRKRVSSAQKEASKGINLLEGPNKERALAYEKDLEEKAKTKAKKKVKVSRSAAGTAMDTEE